MRGTVPCSLGEHWLCSQLIDRQDWLARLRDLTNWPGPKQQPNRQRLWVENWGHRSIRKDSADWPPCPIERNYFRQMPVSRVGGIKVGQLFRRNELDCGINLFKNVQLDVLMFSTLTNVTWFFFFIFLSSCATGFVGEFDIWPFSGSLRAGIHANEDTGSLLDRPTGWWTGAAASHFQRSVRIGRIGCHIAGQPQTWPSSESPL